MTSEHHTRSQLIRALAAAAALASAVAVRLPALLATRPLTFDEGVYGASVLAMRDGAAPFRDVFSSQGPLFLPLLWTFDTLGLRHLRAIRFGMLVAGVLIALGVYVVGRRLGTHWAAAVAAFVAGTSSAGVLAAGVVQSDGLALAFAVWAVAVTVGIGGLGRSRPVLAGMLIGAGMAVKSLFLVPAALAVAWHFGIRRQWRRLAMAAGSAAAVGLVTTLPWGIANVWDQFVAFQVAVSRDRQPVVGLVDTVGRMWRRDAPFLLLAGAALAVAAWRAGRRRWPELRVGSPQAVVLVWLAATAVVLLAGVELDRGSYRFLAFFVVPAVLAFVLLRPPAAVLVAVAVACVALLPRHLHENRSILKPGRPVAVHEEVIAALAALPDGAQVVTDNQGLAWLAGRHPPPFLVDTSWARIVSGYLDTGDVLAGAAQDDVCAVLFYTARLDFLDPELDQRLAGYSLAMDWGEDRRLWVKDDCPARAGQS